MRCLEADLPALLTAGVVLVGVILIGLVVVVVSVQVRQAPYLAGAGGRCSPGPACSRGLDWLCANHVRIATQVCSFQGDWAAVLGN